MGGVMEDKRADKPLLVQGPRALFCSLFFSGTHLTHYNNMKGSRISKFNSAAVLSQGVQEIPRQSGCLLQEREKR